MIPTVILASIICLIYFLRFATKWEAMRRKHNFLPGPIEWPIIGAVIQVITTTGFSGPHWQRLSHLGKKYGQTIGMRIGVLQLAYTQDVETMKEVLNSPDWTSRFPNHPRFREHMLYQNIGIIWSDGSAQSEMRKFVIRTLRTFGFGEMKRAEIFLQEELQTLFQYLDERRKNGRFSNEVFMQRLFETPTLNILWRVMASSRFTYEDPKLKALVMAVDDLAQIQIGLDPEWSFPFLRFIPGCSPSRAKRPSFVILHEFFIDIKNKRRKTGTYNKVQNDFIDYFLHKIDQEKNNPSTIYTDDQFQVTCVDLIFGGLDTIANLLEFGILYMTKFPHVQVKVQSEIEKMVGTDRLPSVKDKTNLKYAEAVFLETLRWANILPVDGRTSSCDTTIRGYNVKKNTLCVLNLTAVHMSQETWGDPEVFRPERFLDESNNIINNEKLVSFGGGKRFCIGYTMAKATWLTLFTGLLQRYSFSPSPKCPQLCTAPLYGITHSVKPYYCVINKRHQRI